MISFVRWCFIFVLDRIVIRYSSWSTPSLLLDKQRTPNARLFQPFTYWHSMSFNLRTDHHHINIYCLLLLLVSGHQCKVFVRFAVPFRPFERFRYFELALSRKSSRREDEAASYSPRCEVYQNVLWISSLASALRPRRRTTFAGRRKSPLESNRR